MRLDLLHHVPKFWETSFHWCGAQLEMGSSASHRYNRVPNTFPWGLARSILHEAGEKSRRTAREPPSTSQTSTARYGLAFMHSICSALHPMRDVKLISIVEYARAFLKDNILTFYLDRCHLERDRVLRARVARRRNLRGYPNPICQFRRAHRVDALACARASSIRHRRLDRCQGAYSHH